MNRIKNYILWTLTLSFIYAAIFYFVFKIRAGNSYLIMAMGYMWIPTVVTIILMKKEDRSLKELGIKFRPNKWFAFAWLIFLIISISTIPVNAAFPGTEISLTMDGFFEQYKDLMTTEQFEQSREIALNNPLLPFVVMIFQGLFAGITINAFMGFGEELGWRGYLYKELEKMGFWKISFYTGILWGFWHAPLILQGHNYPEFPVLGVGMMVIWCILLAPIFTLIRMKSGSVIAAAIGHGTLNGTVGLSIVYIVGGHPLINGLVGLSGFIILAGFDFLIFLYLKRDVKKVIDI